MIRQDVYFLKQHGLIDYSMLFAIEHISKKGDFLKNKDLNQRNLRASIFDLSETEVLEKAKTI